MPTATRRFRLRRLASLITAACALALLGASAAHAERVELIQGFASNLNGVTTGADGNVYVVETGAQKVSVRAPDGSLIRQISLPGAPNTATSATLGPDGRVWVALSSADANRGFARIDAAGVNTPLSTVGLLGCGPVGMATLSSVRMVFTAPSDGSCSVSDNIGGLNADGTLPQGQSTAGPAFDLAAAGGKAYVPDFTGDSVKRWAMGSQGYFQSVEASFSLPIGGSGPDGIEVGGDGRIYVTLYNSGQVARIEPNQGNGTSATIVASGLVNPFGIAAGSDGAVYVASQNARLLRITPDGSQRLIDLPAGFKAWQVAKRGDDIWVTDKDAPQAVVVRNAGRPEPVASVPPAPVTPAPAIPTPAKPAAKPATKLTAAKVLSLAAAKRCASRRSLTLTLRKRATGPKVASVKVTIGTAKAKTYKGTKLKLPVKLTGLPKGSFKVKVAVTLSDGTKVNLTRAYKTCATTKR